ncbi:MAG: hypothetical protein WCV86_00955 [Patescibacteria group bacterium]|jgi:hypothetical protein
MDGQSSFGPSRPGSELPFGEDYVIIQEFREHGVPSGTYHLALGEEMHSSVIPDSLVCVRPWDVERPMLCHDHDANGEREVFWILLPKRPFQVIEVAQGLNMRRVTLLDRATRTYFSVPVVDSLIIPRPQEEAFPELIPIEDDRGTTWFGWAEDADTTCQM